MVTRSYVYYYVASTPLAITLGTASLIFTNKYSIQIALPPLPPPNLDPNQP